MGVWGDIVRIGGVVLSAGLASTGVGLPLAIGIGAAVGGGGGGLADVIEHNDRESDNDRHAQEAKQEADRKLAEQQAEAKRLAERVRRELKDQGERQAFIDKYYRHCERGEMKELYEVIIGMPDSLFKEIAANGVAMVSDRENKKTLMQLLKEERNRRGIHSH